MGQTDPDGDIEMIDPVENQLQESLKNTQNKISGDLSEGFNKLLDENKILQKQLTEIKDELRSQKSSSSEISRNVENDGFRNLEDYITKKLSEGFKNQNEELREQITRLENELKNLSSTSSDEPRHTIESNESKNVESRLKTGVDPQETELEHLRKDNKRLKDENASYQATMGIATSYRFADDDQNNSVHFNKDINDLNKNISKFVTNLKKDVKINSDNVSKLLQHYKYNKETQEEGIQLAKEVLRRLVIDTIINIYESHKSDNSCPENEIINNLKQLLDKLSLLNGSGNNDIMKSFLIKMRQQTYAILGNLAFTDEKGEHLFITHCKARLIYTINQYRIITNESKKKEIESQASSLVRDVISIFYFRRFAQEPIVNYKWIENDKPIDPLTMAGTWDEDEIDNLVVQTCSFPLFGVELENHVKRQIYTPARVIAKEDKLLSPETIIQRAHEYMLAGKYEKSLINVNKLLEIEPNNLLALRQRGETYYIMGNYNESLKDLSKVLKHDPNDADALYIRGAVYRMLKKDDSALNDLNHSLSIKLSASALRIRGETYYAKKEYKKSLKDFTDSLEIDPNNAYVLRMRGEIYLIHDQYDEALTNLNKSLEIEPNDAIALRSRGEIYRLKYRYDDALEDLNKSIKIDPNSGFSLANRGSIYLKKKRYDDAFLDLNKSLKIAPNKIFTLNARGSAYYNTNKYEEAIADFSHSLKIDQNDEFALKQRGIAYYKMEKYDQALSDLTKSLKLDPDNAYILSERGEIYRIMRQENKAITDLEKSLSIDPKNVKALFNRGEIFRLMKEWDKALKYFNESLKINPNHVDSLKSRGATYFTMNKPGESQTDLSKALELCPNDDFSLSYLRKLKK